jgi:hypothetical protein
VTCAVVVVELRGFEPLTPCMPSRDPHHDDHHEPLRSRALHQSRKAGEWWFVWARRARLLRICCAKWLIGASSTWQSTAERASPLRADAAERDEPGRPPRRLRVAAEQATGSLAARVGPGRPGDPGLACYPEFTSRQNARRLANCSAGQLGHSEAVEHSRGRTMDTSTTTIDPTAAWTARPPMNDSSSAPRPGRNRLTSAAHENINRN